MRYTGYLVTSMLISLVMFAIFVSMVQNAFCDNRRYIPLTDTIIKTSGCAGSPPEIIECVYKQREESANVFCKVRSL